MNSVIEQSYLYFIFGADVALMLNEKTGNGNGTIHCSSMKRSETIIVDVIDVCTVIDEHVGDAIVAAVGS